jgi:hypothetical protein
MPMNETIAASLGIEADIGNGADDGSAGVEK